MQSVDNETLAMGFQWFILRLKLLLAKTIENHYMYIYKKIKNEIKQTKRKTKTKIVYKHLGPLDAKLEFLNIDVISG